MKLKGAEELQKQVDESLKDLFKKEKQFMSHLTIARVKKVKNKESFISQIQKIKIPELNFLVKNFKLKQSHLSPRGANYSDIKAYNLK